MRCAIGVVGLGVMGGNLALNMERHGFVVTGYDVSGAKTRAFLDGPAAGKRVVAVASPQALMAALERPRRVLLMLPAGKPVDDAIAHLAPHLEAGDILIDGGNSHYHEDIARAGRLHARGIRYLDCGTSGGVWGLERGYCLMIGG